MRSLIKGLMLSCVLLAVTSIIHAQMRPAKMLPHAAKVSFTVKMNAEQVWEKLIKIKEFEHYSNGMVVSSQNEGFALGARRFYKLADGTEREDELSVFAPQVKKIVYKSIKTNLPIQYCYIHYQVFEKGKNKAKVSLTAYAKPKEKTSKKELKKLITSEFKNIEAGMKQYFR